MSDSTGRIVVEGDVSGAVAAISRLDASLASIDAQAAEAANSLKSIEGASTGFTAVAAKLGSIANGVQAVVSGAQRFKQVADDLAEDTLAAQRATAGLQIGISKTSSALGGYVDDVTLAQIANKAFALGVVETDEELAQLAAGVKVKAEELGEPLEKLLDDATTAIGRKSSKILDNLGIILNQTSAEKIYAESLGKTVEQLTAFEKEQAFAKAAMLEFNRAAGQSRKEVDGLASSYTKGKITIENYKSAMIGFDEVLGRTREAMRQLTEEEIERLSFAEVASEGTAVFKEANKILGQFGASLSDVRRLAHETNRDFQDVLDQQIASLAARDAKREKLALEAQTKAQVAALEDEASALEHEADLIAASGGAQRDTNEFILLGLEARLQAAEVAGQELGIVEATRALEVARAKQTARRGGGKRRDPNAELKRRTEAELAQVDARRQLVEASQELAAFEDKADLDRRRSFNALLGIKEVITAEDDRRRLISFHLIELAREELRVREEAALATKARTKDEIAAVEIELLEVRTEQRLRDFEVQELIREDERAFAEERIAEATREIELLQAEGVATQMLEERRLAAEIAFAERFGTANEQRTLQHQINLSEIEAEKAAQVTAAEAALTQFEIENDLLRARGAVIEHEAERRLELEALVAEAEGDQDARRAILHQRDVARIEEKVRRQQAAVSTTNSFLGKGQEIASTITNEAIKDDEKRQKAQLRVQGLMAIGVGMLEVVKAAAAFASFNYIEGALHIAAAGIAFAQGGIMVQGRTSKGGGAGGGGGGASGQRGPPAEPPENTFTQDDGAEARNLPQTPASAEELSRLRGGPEGGQQQAAPAGSGGTVIQINSSTMISGDTGTLLSDLTDRQERKAYGSDG